MVKDTVVSYNEDCIKKQELDQKFKQHYTWRFNNITFNELEYIVLGKSLSMKQWNIKKLKL